MTDRDDPAGGATDSPDATPDARRDRPETEASYGIPATKEGLLSWEFVASRMADDRTYWLSTTRPDGRPHARPVWGVWVDDRFHCGGGERTRWVRNLAANPEVAVHRESGEAVVIVEGTAERIDEETADPERIERIDAAYDEKYGIRHGTPFFAVRPETVLAWRDYPADATRWRFEDENQ
ncbi:pyridoxamine 5'-phosphate oxidase family protein [Halorussus gelatinilyticus]|uniref:Pyridoxamine 5'-phosphate oxidase family protein n=1 Tax=Halorussus gelatinilyticus TaxID=2937524 RepID=A0A8U0IH71_9EURY|nr:pyridoxamine 5'-phosphate oxidase family protein [Halorussus gelatinilyticus]UPV99653.1 pyridoxamine 5'-phosphate oxidase family protein [Halorussus gelatinilyticus]